VAQLLLVRTSWCRVVTVCGLSGWLYRNSLEGQGTTTTDRLTICKVGWDAGGGVDIFKRGMFSYITLAVLCIVVCTVARRTWHVTHADCVGCRVLRHGCTALRCCAGWLYDHCE